MAAEITAGGNTYEPSAEAPHSGPDTRKNDLGVAWTVGILGIPHTAVYMVGTPIVNVVPGRKHFHCPPSNKTPNPMSFDKKGVASTLEIVRDPATRVTRTR
jgi:hypothetical protein